MTLDDTSGRSLRLVELSEVEAWWNKICARRDTRTTTRCDAGLTLDALREGAAAAALWELPDENGTPLALLQVRDGYVLIEWMNVSEDAATMKLCMETIKRWAVRHGIACRLCPQGFGLQGSNECESDAVVHPFGERTILGERVVMGQALLTHAIEAPLIETLETLQIEFRMQRHPPVRTVAEAKSLRGDIVGYHVKNLFLRDKKKRHFLVTALEDRAFKLKALRQPLGARGGLAFARREHLGPMLGVQPGAVTPLAAINDVTGQVQVVLDAGLDDDEWINCHPLHNRATLALRVADLKRLLQACGHTPLLLHMNAESDR